MEHSVRHTLVFAAGVCLACSLLVSSVAVALKDRHELEEQRERRRHVLEAAGLIAPGARPASGELDALFADRVRGVVVDLGSGVELGNVDPGSFDAKREVSSRQTSRPAPDNAARVQRLPKRALIYEVSGDARGAADAYVLPVQGAGLWSTLYGYLALEADTKTVRGLTFYHHGETPGLGGEVDNPRWKALWPGRKAFNERWVPALEVVKGSAGSAETEPYRVDGLSGATITSRGVTATLHFWLGPDGFSPYLARRRAHVAPERPSP